MSNRDEVQNSNNKPDGRSENSASGITGGNQDRVANWIAKLESGLTLACIAREEGLSRERVRQLVRKAGYDHRRGLTGRRPIEVATVLRAMRDDRCRSLTDLSRIANCTELAARRVLEESGQWATANDVWRARQETLRAARTELRRKVIVAALQGFFLQTARIPSINDCINGELPFSHMMAVRAFSSWNLALNAAGFPAQSQGGPGHRN